MLKSKVIILLTGLMCLGSISGFFTVICQGSYGHIAVESTIHNHCECPETNQTDNRDNFAKTMIGLLIDHSHCKNSVPTPNIIIPARKNIKISTRKVFTTNFISQSTSTHFASSLGHWVIQVHKISSFHAPLRTVIILA